MGIIFTPPDPICLSNIWDHRHQCIGVVTPHSWTYPQHLKRCSNTSYICYVKVGSVWAAILSLNHEHQNNLARHIFFEICPPPGQRIQSKSDTDAYQQHIKVLKHIYKYACGMSLWGFGALTMTLQHHLDSAMPPISQKSTPNFRGISV